MEHRCGERVTLRVPVRLRRSGWEAFGMLTNASLSGGFVRTRLQSPVLSLLELDVFGTHVSAYVIRVNTRGLALEWFEFAPAGVARLLTPLTSLGRSKKAAPLSTLAQPRYQLGAPARALGAASTIGLGSLSPSLGRVRIGIGSKLDGNGRREQVEGFAEDVGEIATVRIGY